MCSKSYQYAVVQIARLGDLVQSRILIQKLLFENGAGSVFLVVDRRYTQIANLLVGEENVLGLPIEAILKNGLSKSFRNQWQLAKDISKLLGKIKCRTVVNLNYNRVAAVIADSVPASYRLGAKWIDVVNDGIPDEQLIEIFRSNIGIRRGKVHLSDVWASYASSTIQPSTEFKIYPELKPVSLTSTELSQGKSLLRSQRLQPDVAPVALIPGSGYHHREWSIHNWSKLTQKLIDFSPVLLVGTKKEAEKADSILRNVRPKKNQYPVVSISGLTDLKSLSAVLSLCKLVIGVDTGSLHLATAMGTKCFGIYFGSMNFQETGPYGNNNLVIIPDDLVYPCHENHVQLLPEIGPESIKANVVIKVVEGLLKHCPVNLNGVRLYHSRLTRQQGLVWTRIGSERYNASPTDDYILQNDHEKIAHAI